MDKITEFLKKYFKDALTEESKEEIKVMFESLVSEKISAQLTEKETQLEEQYKNELVEFKNMLIEKINDYIEVAVEDFVKENTESIENSIKVEMANKVMTKIISTLKEDFVEIPETEIDTVKDLATQIKTLKEELNEVRNEEIDSKKQIFEYEKAIRLMKLVESLTDIDKEKIITLVENLDVANINDFEKKSKIIIENFHKSSKTTDPIVEDSKTLIEENLETKETYEIDKYLPRSNAK